MEEIKRIFNIASYLQYSLMVADIFFIYRPIILRLKEQQFTGFYTGPFLLGPAISFSSLQAGRKTQNKISQLILRNSKYTRYCLIFISLTTIILFSAVFAYFVIEKDEIKQISTGLLVLSISFFGLSRMMIEISEYQTSIYQQND